jgi:hypothetical protein
MLIHAVRWGCHLLATRKPVLGKSPHHPAYRLIAGWLAGQIAQGTGFGIVCDLVIGIVGAFLGSWLFAQLGIHGCWDRRSNHQRNNRGAGPLADYQSRWRRGRTAGTLGCSAKFLAALKIGFLKRPAAFQQTYLPLLPRAARHLGDLLLPSEVSGRYSGISPRFGQETNSLAGALVKATSAEAMLALGRGHLS